MRISFPPPKPVIRRTCSALEYLQILYDDLGFDRLHRNDHFLQELKKPIKFIDELAPYEISKLITILRDMKARRNG